MTVGTQAALLAGFAFTGVIEAPWDYLEELGVPEYQITLCVCSTLFGMLFQVLAIVKSVQISILGPGLALRGSEGSMTRALSVMRHEQRRLHWQFYIGLFFFHVATGASPPLRALSRVISLLVLYSLIIHSPVLRASHLCFSSLPCILPLCCIAHRLLLRCPLQAGDALGRRRLHPLLL